MPLISPHCVFCITRAEVDLALDQTISPKVRELRLSAIKQVPSYLMPYVDDNFQQQLIDAVCEKKLGFIMKAETKGEIQKIMRPALPQRTCNGVICHSPYHIPEEELMIWAHISPHCNLILPAEKRYLELFQQVYGMTVDEYLRRKENER